MVEKQCLIIEYIKKEFIFFFSINILKAVKMGATPAQYGFVFGIANLSLFLFSPVFGKYGTKFGPKLCFNFGAVLQVYDMFLCTTSDIVYSFVILFLLRFLVRENDRYVSV